MRPVDALIVLRGGGRGGQKGDKADDPRTAMIQWALQKVERELPEAIPQTILMLLKAEARTTSAILHTKSVHQTREVVNAALRRAALPPLGSTASKQSHDLPALAEAMDAQANALSSLADLLAKHMTKDDFNDFLATWHAQNIFQTETLNKLVIAVANLEQFVSASAPTPKAITVSCPPSPLMTTPVDEHIMCDNDKEAMGEVPTFDLTDDKDNETLNDQSQEKEKPTILDKFEKKSLQVQCERVVSGRALMPFRA